jgi:hypothetical protein
MLSAKLRQAIRCVGRDSATLDEELAFDIAGGGLLENVLDSSVIACRKMLFSASSSTLESRGSPRQVKTMSERATASWTLSTTSTLSPSASASLSALVRVLF